MEKVRIVDGHTDVLTKILEGKIRFSENNKNTSVDLPKLTKGNVKTAFFAICTQSSEKYTFRYYRALINELLENDINRLSLIKTVSDVKTIFKSDGVGVLLHLEGADVLKADLSNFQELYDFGIRSIGIVWSNNSFGSSCVNTGSDMGEGLSVSGKLLVKKCNEMGVLVDVSHLNERGFWDVMSITNKPVIASHSNCFSIAQNPRNLKDKQIIAISETGGLVGISVNPVFIKNLNLKPGELISPVYSNVSIDEMIRHIEHIKNLVGINYVGLGSDFEGGPVPFFLKDASEYQNFVEHLHLAGFSKNEIEKICYKNFLRVFKEIL